MREMPALVKVESHEGIARFQHSKQHCLVCLCAGVRLYIGVFCTEELLYALDGKCLYLVNHLAAAIIALARITFSILVCQVGSHGLHYFVTDEILRCNQLHSFELAFVFQLDKVKNFLVSSHVYFEMFMGG